VSKRTVLNLNPQKKEKEKRKMVPKANIWSYNNLKKENLMEKSE